MNAPSPSRQSLFDVLFAGVLLVLLAVPVFTPMPRWREFSQAPEQWNLLSLAKSLDGLLPAYEQHFNEHFLGRERLIRLDYDFRLHVLGETVYHDVLIGKDGWLYYTGEGNLDYYQRSTPLSPAQLAAITRRIEATQTALRARGIAFALVVAPNKETIYPQYLPDGVPVLGQESQLDQLLAYAPGLPILDLRPALLAERSSAQLYFRTDTHWNPYGAYLAYRAVLDGLRPQLSLPAQRLEDFERTSQDSRGDLAALLMTSAPLREESIDLTPRFTRRAVFPATEGRTVVSQVADVSLPAAVIYRDSFFNGLTPYFAEHFHQAVYLWSYDVDLDFIDAQKPDLVLLEVAERYLPLLAEESQP